MTPAMTTMMTTRMIPPRKEAVSNLLPLRSPEVFGAGVAGTGVGSVVFFSAVVGVGTAVGEVLLAESLPGAVVGVGVTEEAVVILPAGAGVGAVPFAGVVGGVDAVVALTVGGVGAERSTTANG